MKKFMIISSAVVLAGLVTPVFIHTGNAQTAVVESTPKPLDSSTSTGTITQITTDAIYLRSDGSAQPVAYRVTKNTTFSDDQEAPVPVNTVKTGRAVIVYYVLDGANRVATKFTIRNAP